MIQSHHTMWLPPANNNNNSNKIFQQFFNQKPCNPIQDKSGENNHRTWQQQSLAAIRGQLLEDHLFKERIPQQFSAADDQLAGIEFSQYKQWVQDDQNLIYWLLASMDSACIPKMVGCTFSYQIWEKIESYFAESTKFRIKQLKAQLKMTKKQGLTAKEYISKIKTIADSLAALGKPLKPTKRIEAILDGLNEEYQMLYTTINSKPELYTLFEVETIILTDDDMLNQFAQILVRHIMWH
ncbi:uncharacterized protein DS421_20g686630 [Arachis hypogaea]|uniref:Retrotransposon gag domain-containing protein n=1 Tax=Arachis hypogaea TaxID=3818 RepID=A0A444WZX1_ARAHY|nr:uncharacterized protein DS421_20g686630 [Arachis hypogaea]RYQ82996.1 hypothetical protein Ahy_B10g101608 [Arachis hypogaea]